MKKNENIYNIVVLLFLTFCVQFTDLKIGVIKISELLLLILVPIILFKKINKYIFYLLLFFSLTALVSLAISFFADFKYLGNSIIKAPYVITIGRYLELVTCLVLCTISFLFFRSLRNKEEFDYFLKRLVNINLYIILIFVIIYFAVIFDIISINDTRIVYGDFRLRGYFVEGGPFGLMLSFIFILTSYLKKSKSRWIKRLFLVLVIFFLAKSKAGFLCIVIWVGLEHYDFIKQKAKEFMYPIIIIGVVGFYFLFVNISAMYVAEFNRIQISLKERPQDPNLMMGRISGFYIVPNMVRENPFFGIGLGNYPLLRNNEEYRTFFPLPNENLRILDAHGFGGIIDILVETGLIGLLCFFYILITIWNSLPTRNERTLLIGFLLLFLFGVQIYFLYPWVLLGIILVRYKVNNEISS